MEIILNIVILYMFAFTIAYPISKYTTIGNSLWFGDFIYSFADKFNKQSTKDLIVSASYSKLFICRSCHTFWITLAVSMFMLSPVCAIFNSLITYLLIRRYYDKEQG